ncbi:hypothetical protein F5Y15DRAFT_368659 [Xylariaceae sp. FL0016]|nr:hypothetical protein F5Y15DRAFT_368659 [Xylariaceae sp. FL0016]
MLPSIQHHHSQHRPPAPSEATTTSSSIDRNHPDPALAAASTTPPVGGPGPGPGPSHLPSSAGGSGGGGGGVGAVASPTHKRGLEYDNVASPDSNTSLPEDQRTKKRRAGPGSRGVANLTPEQLAKKRANDREAQRAIRERTKNQIETLEKRIQDLTSQQPYQELQAVIRRKEAVEAENAEIKNRLASIMSLIQPVLTGQQAEGPYASAIPPYVPPSQPPQPPPSSHSARVSTPASIASPSSAVDPSWHNQALPQHSPKDSQVTVPNPKRHDLLHHLEMGGGEQLKLDFLLDPSQRVNRMQTGINGAQDTPGYQHLPMKHDWNGASYPPPRSNSAMSGSSQGHQRIDSASDHTSRSPKGNQTSITAPIRNLEPTCPLDHLLLDFLHERRQRAAEGVPTQEIVGPRYPSVSSLLNPANSAFSHPLSKVFTDILATFPGICTLPERVAVLYIMFLIMRWQISPTQENYDLLPRWVRPVASQFHTPHPAWVDHIPFPAMREKLTVDYNPTNFLFDNFFIPFTTTISVNWPYEDTDTLLQSPDGSELLINPVFERHLRRLDSWTLGDAFDKSFPLLRGTYKLKRDGSTRESLDERASER